MSARDGIAWLREAHEFGTDYCVTFARGLEPLELLTRMGCDPGTAAPMGLVDATETYFDTGVETIRAGTSRGWAYAVETTGNRGFEDGVLDAVSAGTEAVLVYGDCNPAAYLIHAENGEVVCGFEAGAPGADPKSCRSIAAPAGLRRIPRSGTVQRAAYSAWTRFPEWRRTTRRVRCPDTERSGRRTAESEFPVMARKFPAGARSRGREVARTGVRRHLGPGRPKCDDRSGVEPLAVDPPAAPWAGLMDQ
ncbi:DUF6461 domain-containing protein [Embleya sp. NPDC008237]|uniref:DUF6461 domain-containing protein n=1 Tax=Embleya sp. NPDC008237 TaxID=3363978 RepID=UPI0036E07A75